jgi:hypothetical protein
MGDITVSVGAFLAFLIIFCHWYSLRSKKNAMQKVKPQLHDPKLSNVPKKNSKFDYFLTTYPADFR